LNCQEREDRQEELGGWGKFHDPSRWQPGDQSESTQKLLIFSCVAITLLATGGDMFLDNLFIDLKKKVLRTLLLSLHLPSFSCSV
jgi:hypothetical protein